MNNVGAFDWCNKDWTHDNDFALSRATQEFPRISKSKMNNFEGPELWGTKSPKFFELVHSHPELMKDSIEPGVWHVSHIPGSDHLDCCGAPPFMSPFRVTLNREYRFRLWRTLFVRLKTIEG